MNTSKFVIELLRLLAYNSVLKIKWLKSNNWYKIEGRLSEGKLATQKFPTAKMSPVLALREGVSLWLV